MVSFWTEVLKYFVAFLFGVGGVKLLDIIGEKSKFKRERKAVKEDKLEEKEDEVKELTKTVDQIAKVQADQTLQLVALQDALKCVLLDRVIHLGQSYIRDGEIDFDDRRRLREMHNSYHQGLGGNGDAEAIMKAVDALPLKNH